MTSGSYSSDWIVTWMINWMIKGFGWFLDHSGQNNSFSDLQKDLDMILTESRRWIALFEQCKVKHGFRQSIWEHLIPHWQTHLHILYELLEKWVGPWIYGCWALWGMWWNVRVMSWAAPPFSNRTKKHGPQNHHTKSNTVPVCLLGVYHWEEFMCSWWCATCSHRPVRWQRPFCRATLSRRSDGDPAGVSALDISVFFPIVCAFRTPAGKCPIWRTSTDLIQNPGFGSI